MDPFTQKLLDRTRQRREILQKKLHDNNGGSAGKEWKKMAGLSDWCPFSHQFSYASVSFLSRSGDVGRGQALGSTLCHHEIRGRRIPHTQATCSGKQPNIFLQSSSKSRLISQARLQFSSLFPIAGRGKAVLPCASPENSSVSSQSGRQGMAVGGFVRKLDSVCFNA